MSGIKDVPAAARGTSTEQALDARTLTAVLLGAFERLQEQSDALSELDRAIGDGDHGTTIARAAGRIHVHLTATDAPTTIGGVLQEVGSVFLDVDGGATGPLFGSFFSGMANAAGSRRSIDSAGLPSLYDGGIEALRGLTRAVPGDKTLMDALVPAVDSVVMSAGRGESLLAQLEAAASAAEAGALATRDLRARHGRAKHLGDRVVGHEDPGARSIAILFRGIADEGTRVLSVEVDPSA
jgi:dihydroxyacetone kinase-like protein